LKTARLVLQAVHVPQGLEAHLNLRCRVLLGTIVLPGQ